MTIIKKTIRHFHMFCGLGAGAKGFNQASARVGNLVGEFECLGDQAWRERIGNAVPPDASKAIAEVMGTTLLLAWKGETFVLSATPIWVQPVAIALTMAQEGWA